MNRSPQDKLTLTADFGGTRIKLGVIDASGAVRAQRAIDAESRGGLAARLDVVDASLRTLVDEALLRWEDVVAAGMAFPCLVDPATRRITSAIDKYPDAPGLDLVAWAQDALGLPLAVENDANAALAGEWRFGAGRGTRSCVMMTLGTGVGTSAVVDGVPLRGQHGQAGNLGGHFIINAFGRECVCGNVGCVETEASSWILPQIAQEDPRFAESALSAAEKIDFAAVFSLAGTDEVARELRDRCIRVWSAAAVNLVHAYDPELVIVGGGIMKSPEPILSMMQKFIDDHAWVGWGKVRVAAGELGDAAALVGLDYLARQVASSHSRHSGRG